MITLTLAELLIIGIVALCIHRAYRGREQRRIASKKKGKRQFARAGRDIGTQAHAGRDIKTVLPFDIDAHLERQQQDKEWFRAQLAVRDAFILDQLRKQQTPVGFPLMNISSRKPMTGNDID